jgi:hypothetical protein
MIEAPGKTGVGAGFVSAFDELSCNVSMEEPFVRRSVRSEFRYAPGDDDLLLVLGADRPADGSRVALDAEDHPGLEEARDEGIKLLAVLLRNALPQQPADPRSCVRRRTQGLP